MGRRRPYYLRREACIAAVVVLTICGQPSDGYVTPRSLLRPTTFRADALSSRKSSVVNVSPSSADKKVKERKRTTPKPTKWIACSSTKELTRAVQAYIRPGDNVAELGSALRETSRAICEAVGSDGRVQLVDVKRGYPMREDIKRTTAMRREGDEEEFFTDRAKFIEIVSFQLWRSSLFFDTGSSDRGNTKGYDVLIADVSSIVGNDLDLTAMSLIKEFLELNDNLPGNENGGKCRTVIVKSGSLNAWARRLVHAQRLFSGSVSSSVSSRLQRPLSEEEIEGGGSIDVLDEKPSRAGFVAPLVIATVGVEEYRQTIPYVVRPGDSALEVGCHLGTSTVDIHEAADGGKNDVSCGCIGVDIGTKIIAGAKKRYPEVPFEVADAWHTGELLRLRKTHLPAASGATNTIGYDAVYVDVGGLSGSDGLLEAISLLSALGRALEPRCLVIKSNCVRRLASSLVAFSDVWQNDEEMRNKIRSC